MSEDGMGTIERLFSPTEDTSPPETKAAQERQEKWDRRYVQLAREVATWSKDPSTKVGALIVDPLNRIASSGFNGFPPEHCDAPELYANREYKYEHVIHAEINALNFLGGRCPGFSLYTSFPCCPNCIQAAHEAGIARIVGPYLERRGRTQEWVFAWEGRTELSKEMASTAGIEWVELRV